MATEAKNTNYWISSTALYIQLNAMGEPDYIQCSVVSGASILCYMQGIPGLEYDASHNYQRWSLAAYPSIFPDSERKYVYVAIPRLPTADNNQATVVFPGQKIDLYGKAITTTKAENGTAETALEQIGNEAYYYIFTGGIISEVKTDTDNTRKREWVQHVDCGSLATDEALASGGEGAWWKYNSVTDTVTFLKEILNASFDDLTAKVAKITKLVLNGNEVTGVADNATMETSPTAIVTPQYLGQFGVKHFLAKDKDDVASGLITFLQGLRFGNSTDFRIDGNGNAILSSVMLKVLKSIGFNEAEQSGFAIKQRSDGKYQMLLTDLIVWGKAIFNTLVIRELSYVGGNIVLSPAAGKISYIKEVYSETTNELIGWKCYLLADDGTTATINSWKVDDQVRCKTFNIASGVYENVSNKDYWRLVTKVSTENEVITDSEGHELYDGKKFAWIQIAKDNCMEGSDNPATGDTIVLMGNKTNTSRQHLLMMETEGDSAPTFTMYRGINSYSLKGKSIFDVGFDGINIVSKYYHLTTANGEKIWTPLYRGDWKEGTEYDYYDQVSWHGTMWLCIVSDGQTTTEEPTADSSYWKAMTEIIPVEIYFEHDFQQGFAYGREGEIRCKVYRGIEDLTSCVKKWKIERKSDDSVSDSAWALRDKVKNFNGTISLICSQDVSVDDFGKGRKVIFTVTAIGDDKKQLAQEKLTFT
nr:MAG TPA: tail protein [Caudoviricetes sp.]